MQADDPSSCLHIYGMIDRSNVDEVDVLIAGGGPTGLTLACDLARRGIVVRLVEKNLGPFPGSRGKGLSPRTLEVFDDLGVADAVLAAGTEYPRMHMHLGWVTLPWDMVKRAKRSPEVPYPNIWMHSQNETEAVLRARLEELGGAVEMGTELVAFHEDAGSVAITLAREGREERLRARYLVGADGAHGTVRKALGVRFEGERLAGPAAIVGDIRVDDLRRDVWHVWPRAKGGAIALCPLPGGKLFQLYLERDALPGEEVTEASVRAIVSESIGKGAPRISAASWLSVFRPNVRLVDRYRVGRVFLAGDAAHVHPPSGGQGLNSGVQDAYNLGWKLAAVLRGAPEALLDTYEEERRPVAASILGLSTRLYRERSLRRGDETKQLQTNYRGTSLAPKTSERGRVRAGDRAPDAEGRDEGGESARLFDSFRGPNLRRILPNARARRAHLTGGPGERHGRRAS